MNVIRQAFLDAGRAAYAVASSPRVAERWEQPSALAELPVRGLTGHLVRATTSVHAYLDRGEPDGPAISAAEYYVAVLGNTTDLTSTVNVGVREVGMKEAAEGPLATVQKLSDGIDHLERRLAEEPDGRRVRVFQDLVLELDDYLATRMVELTVHTDDLAVSVGLGPVELPNRALDLAISTMVDVARTRHGGLALLRALARRERDDIDALRVF